MKKFIVETYYTCTFKTVHTLNDLNDKELSKIDDRNDGSVELIDVKLNNRKTKKVGEKEDSKIENIKVDTPVTKKIAETINKKSIDNSNIEHLDEEIFYLRDVKVKVNVVGIDEIQIPSGRSKKLVNTVEASTRLDAIASAGFRLSRTKIIERIENGMLRLNGSKVKKPTINLKIGDKLELENKGFIEILNLEITKRERWKVKLLRK